MDYPTKKIAHLRLEKPLRITKHRWPEATVPIASIWCITYNHRHFIRDAIEGFLCQETDFPVEILIHDDASTDGTDHIIRDYKARYPGLIRPILQSENQRSQGRRPLNILAPLSCGEFIALCEGDDYWTDPSKLQRQWQFLQENPHCSCCFHRTSLVDDTGRIIQEDYFVPEAHEFDFRQCLTELKKQYATCAMVFRKAALASPKGWYLRRPTDMFLELQLAVHGNLGFIDRNMGAYRKHTGGAWTGISGVEQNIEMIYRYHLLLEDPEIFEAYHPIIRQLIRKLEKGLCLRSDCAGVVWKQSFIYGMLAHLSRMCKTVWSKGSQSKNFLLRRS